MLKFDENHFSGVVFDGEFEFGVGLLKFLEIKNFQFWSCGNGRWKNKKILKYEESGFSGVIFDGEFEFEVGS